MIYSERSPLDPIPEFCDSDIFQSKVVNTSGGTIDVNNGFKHNDTDESTQPLKENKPMKNNAHPMQSSPPLPQPPPAPPNVGVASPQPPLPLPNSPSRYLSSSSPSWDFATSTDFIHLWHISINGFDLRFLISANKNSSMPLTSFDRNKSAPCSDISSKYASSDYFSFNSNKLHHRKLFIHGPCSDTTITMALKLKMDAATTESVPISMLRPKPFDNAHLKVLMIRRSRSGDKRLPICTAIMMPSHAHQPFDEIPLTVSDYADLVKLAFHPKFLSVCVEKERRAILSEQMMNTTEYRIDCMLLQFLHSENKLSKRFPIGLEERIKKWDSDEVCEVYENWYFPDLFVGDIHNIPKVVHQIEAVFGQMHEDSEVPTVRTRSAFGAMASFLVPKLPGALGGFSADRLSTSVDQQKPNIISHRANQFRKEDPNHSKKLLTYFNSAYFSLCVGEVIALTVDVGSRVSAVAMAMGLISLIGGTMFYGNKPPKKVSLLQLQECLSQQLQRENKFACWAPKCFIMAMLLSVAASNLLQMWASSFILRSSDFWTKPAPESRMAHRLFRKAHGDCTITQGEQVKIVLSAIPIFACTIFFNTMLAQLQTFSVQQGSCINIHITNSFKLPPVLLQAIPYFLLSILFPIYVTSFVPLARKFTGNELGVPPLQRIGIGLFMVILAALIEKKRKGMALDRNGTLMSIFWIMPQFVIFGVLEVFTSVGLIEFFYKQSLAGMQSFWTAMTYWLCSNDLNKERLDLFYWLLAGLSMLNFFDSFGSSL